MSRNTRSGFALSSKGYKNYSVMCDSDGTIVSSIDVVFARACHFVLAHTESTKVASCDSHPRRCTVVVDISSDNSERGQSNTWDRKISARYIHDANSMPMKDRSFAALVTWTLLRLCREARKVTQPPPPFFNAPLRCARRYLQSLLSRIFTKLCIAPAVFPDDTKRGEHPEQRGWEDPVAVVGGALSET